MYQVVQYQKDGTICVVELPAPACPEGGILVACKFSLISAGTEKISVTNAQGSMITRAKKQPDQVKAAIQTMKRDGLLNTYNRIQSKLDSYKSLGYSASGIVVETDCTEFAVGDRVACAGAGYANHAEYIGVPKNLAVKLPDNVPFEDAAFTTLGAIAMQGFRQAEPVLGETVAVIGLGLLGQITVQLLKAAGCKVIGFDVDEKLFEKAKAFGCDLTLPSSSERIETVKAFTRGLMCDSVILTASTESNQPLELALNICRKKGKTVIVGAVGLNVPRGPFYLKEIDLRIACSYGPGRYDTNYEERGQDYPAAYVRWTENRNMISFVELIASGAMNVKSMTTHIFDVKAAEKAYDIITGKTPEPFTGILIKYDTNDSKPKRTIDNNTFKKKSAIGIGFIGAGTFAQSYLLPALKNCGVDFASVSTATAVNAKSAAQKFGFAKATTDSADVIADKNVNLVFCAARHDAHGAYVINSLKAEKSVFVEKPLAVNLEELDEIRTLVNSGKSQVMVGFNRRFSKPFLEIAKFFQGRKDPLAMIYRINCGFIPKSHWVQDEKQKGRIIGEVCHFIDIMTFLTGALPTKVYANSVSSGNDESNDHDTTTININFADGSIGTVHYFANGDSGLPKEYFEAFSERSCAIMDNFTNVSLIRAGRTKKLSFNGQKGIAEEVATFISAVKSGASAPIPFDELYAVSKACILAVESIKSGLPLNVD